MKKKLKITQDLEKENHLEREAFLKLNTDQRLRVCCEISELMQQIQYENGVLPKEKNFILRSW